MEKISVAVLGATGTVGQKILAMLENHPIFQVTQILSSQRNIGRKYADVCHWRETAEMPEIYHELILESSDKIQTKFAISSLPSDAAAVIEPELCARGIHVISNASTFRMDEQTPLIIPEINGHHIELIDQQKTPGKLITNPNCATVFLAMALHQLTQFAPIEYVNVVTLQALSGAGYPGVSSMDIMGNIIPYISNEEDKIETEAKKILGEVTRPLDLNIMTHVNRVPVLHGHTVAMHVTFEKDVNINAIEEHFQTLAKEKPELYQFYTDQTRPQPLKDITHYDQRAHIGRLKQGSEKNRVGLISMGHNLVRGAAGAAILNLELMQQYIAEKSWA